MPFEEKTMAELRRSLVEEIKSGERSISAICRIYGVSRPTAYKWLARFDAGVEMASLSRAPHHIPHRTPLDIEALVVEARRAHPCWGAHKLKKYLERERGVRYPAASTVNEILIRHELITEEAREAARPYKRFESHAPNILWQTDFKGHFAMLNGSRCYPLTVTDDYSRYSLCISAKSNERLSGVLESFLHLFREYGLPYAILCDNGNPWGCFGGYTKFEVIMMDYDVRVLHGSPGHPQTQGKEERFHRTMKRELLAFERINDHCAAQAKFDAFRKEYNEVRPHCALGYAVPAERYKVSLRSKPEKITEWEYPPHADVRIISNDSVQFNGQRFYLSEALEGRRVALLASTIDGIIDVLYRNFRLAQIDLHERRLISKRIVRIKC